jgi:histidine triad (HIT) family protein
MDEASEEGKFEMNARAYDDQNVFARILRGELPSAKVYEDDDVVVIMDVMPQGKGHTLVIPKPASRNILDMKAGDLQKTILAVQRVARAVQKAFDAPGILVTQFNEPAAGQTVFHTHFHVIPRFEGVALKPHSGKMADANELADHAERIKGALGGLG